ncbi:dihydroneopterin aldolase [Pseudooceanicola sp. C21-150M6]|uniref:dihydroneopterin aldolase n=1 Tax=Pseudooceanicola sp. C21-150M6 TaxID=3434355 RepID=UPI003D7F3B63
MNSTISQAFGHPLDRSEAMAGAAPRDRISLRDYITAVEIGAYQLERGTTQRLRFNVVVEVRPFDDPLEDDVDRILSYDLLVEAIEAELASQRLNLLETLAENVATRILREPQAERCFMRIEKLDRGTFALGVEIVRSKAEAQPLADIAAQQATAPRVVFLNNAAIGSAGLSAWLDAMQADAVPLILTCGPSDLTPPQAAQPLAQRRITLLAIEQNAWVLAGRDPRCVVVDSRSELDWGMKHGQISVWAPSKMVLDAVTPPAVAAGAEAMARWLAEGLGALEFRVLTGPDLAQGPTG